MYGKNFSLRYIGWLCFRVLHVKRYYAVDAIQNNDVEGPPETILRKH